MPFTESVIEEAALGWLEGLGYAVQNGIEIAPGELYSERADYGQILLNRRLRDALVRLNPGLPDEALDEAFRKIANPEGPSLEIRNRAFHRHLVDGVNVEFRREDGSIGGAQAKVVDFDDAGANDWLAVNQYTVVENKHNRRPDIVVFINGIPLGVVELKNAADENATIWSAFRQLQTYQNEIPSLFALNAALVVSDGMQARIGAVGAGREWFKPWRAIEEGRSTDSLVPELEVLIKGVFEKRRFLDLVRDFIVFEDFGGGAIQKKIAGYHQFHAVKAAIEETLRASSKDGGIESAESRETPRKQGGDPGDRRIGVVWHTQGAGKSLTMAFYAGRIIRDLRMENPTIVVITDRNDLDGQLFGTFSRCRELLRQPPYQVESRADLREKLQVKAGGAGGRHITIADHQLGPQRGRAHL